MYIDVDIPIMIIIVGCISPCFMVKSQIILGICWLYLIDIPYIPVNDKINIPKFQMKFECNIHHIPTDPWLYGCV